MADRQTRNILLYTDEDGVWIADVPSLPGCHNFGETRDEAIANIKEAIELWLEVAEEYGDDIPADYSDFEVASIDVVPAGK